MYNNACYGNLLRKNITNKNVPANSFLMNTIHINIHYSTSNFNLVNNKSHPRWQNVIENGIVSSGRKLCKKKYSPNDEVLPSPP